MSNDNIKICDSDLTNNDVETILSNCKYVAIDTETAGLNPLMDKLCYIQLYTETMTYILKYDEEVEYTNLKTVLKNNFVIKVFHHAVFDIRFIIENLKCPVSNIVCTKILAKLIHPHPHTNSLKNLLSEYLDIEITKEYQLSDWSSKPTDAQVEYMVNDVKHLVPLWKALKVKLNENGENIAAKCFDFVLVQSILMNNDINNIFAYEN